MLIHTNDGQEWMYRKTFFYIVMIVGELKTINDVLDFSPKAYATTVLLSQISKERILSDVRI